jgi:hypothetical protein
MLAYTFFHWPREGAPDYDRHVAEFLQAMEADKPLGYLGGLSMRHGPAAWLPGPAYLDWYRVGGFADLGMLNEGAVSGSRRAPHDDVAAMAAGGAGGVYELQQGPADFRDARVAHWFGKPAGMRYAELFGELAGARVAVDAADGSRVLAGVRALRSARRRAGGAGDAGGRRLHLAGGLSPISARRIRARGAP